MNTWYSAIRLLTTSALTVLIADADAQITWRRTYGGFDTNRGMSVRVASDGGYVIAGSTGSFGAGGQAYVLKIDEMGLLQWTAVIGDNGVQSGMACRVLEDGYVLAGTTSTGVFGGYDVYVVRLDLNGQVLWEQSYGTTEWDLGKDIEVVDDGFVVVGTSYGSGSADALVLRIDADGEEVWRSSIGDIGEDEGNGVIVTSGGEFVVTGAMANVEDDDRTDAFVSKLSVNGDVQWTEIFGGDSADYFYSAVEMPDGGFACSGGTGSYSDVKQILLVKVDADGGQLWQEVFGSMGDSEAREIQLNLNGDLAMASYNSYNNAGGKDMVLFIATAAGSFMLGKNYGGIDDEDGFSIQCTADGGYILVGIAEGYGPGITSIYVVKAAANGETVDDTVYEMFDASAVEAPEATQLPFILSPDPASSFTRLATRTPITSATLFDSQGRLVRTWSAPVPQELDLRGLAEGTYQFVAIGDDGRRMALPLMIAGN
ncbi:MAG TPA: T9SS type A sorting domain-containing protein [Flavobacteriales bacterium]|nr:T9SS type A sorting domain-containing protein [Flavobacteriales bacterium]HNE80929.1 T9SS type A sorting domain-containing protein [Flavobacteriales bacterium]HNI03730.1 T9SS type A sorting domain-containing protein [Flavobacteriales bacterium]HNK41517.1 T9SS type A sorting domain-containing protein [Flavobacteriales bacterium]HNK69271.1 T9SS type A sorting domain-containing protein [Flavobacteriales bacterium]